MKSILLDIWTLA